MQQTDLLDLDADPYVAFERWFHVARQTVDQAEAAALATATANGAPSVRIMLFKGIYADGFHFYTNCESRKARELDANPRAAILFFWQPLHRQVRIEGAIAHLDADVSDAYFASRDRGSQLGAWASRQSEPIASRQALLDDLAAHDERFDGQDVPRPPHWGGYRLVPDTFEFWEAREGRLHERIRYIASRGRWVVERLAP